MGYYPDGCEYGTCAHGCGYGPCTHDHGVVDFIDQPRCDICGENIKIDALGFYAEEAGEFWNLATDDAVLAHAQCGLDAGLEVA